MTDLILTSEKVKKAHQLATSLFNGKKDRGGKPYIEHLERVAIEAVKKYRNLAYSKEPIAATKEDFENVYCAALMHDVLEDTDCTTGEITIQFGLKVFCLVNVLSTCENIDYADYIECIGFYPSAICIKLADLEDNMNITRLNKPLKEGDLQRLKKYHDSWLYLTKRLKEI